MSLRNSIGQGGTGQFNIDDPSGVADTQMKVEEQFRETEVAQELHNEK